MGVTGDPVWLEDVLRKALGDRLVVEGDWVNRGTGGTMGDIWGVMIHHTGNINERVANIRDGVQQPTGFLRGPLAQCLLTPDGKCHLIAVGPCNHAGPGSFPGVGAGTGNRRLIGFECCWPTLRPNGTFDPNERWKTPLIITMRDATAAVLKKLGVGSARIIGHKEWTRDKIDPGNMSMDWFRGEVQKDLDDVVFPGELQAPLAPLEAAAAISAPSADIIPTEPEPVGTLCDQLSWPLGQVEPQFEAQQGVDPLAEMARLIDDLRSQIDDLRAMNSRTHQRTVRPWGGKAAAAFYVASHAGRPGPGAGEPPSPARAALTCAVAPSRH